MKPFSIAAIAFTTLVAFATPPLAQGQDIVDVASANNDFSTLVAAVKAAGLVETLKGKGPFTVFAPTDAAFKKLPPATLEGLLKPESKDKLASILKFHVLPGSYDSARLGKARIKRFGIKSAQGSDVAVDLTNGVVVSGATVTQPDLKASNGIIHAVDTVMLPRKIKAAMRAAALRDKVTEKAAAMKVKAGEAGSSVKAKAEDLADKAKAAAAAAAKAVSPPAPLATPPSAPAKKP